VIDYQASGKFVLYLRCSAGESGPYQAPGDVYSKKKKGGNVDRTMRYWIHVGAVTTYANKNELSELFEKFNAVPYDDRINRLATVDSIRRGYVEDFLRESDSSLASGLKSSILDDLLLSLEVANETDTDLEIRNIGVLMFTDKPEKFIPGARIDLVRFNSPDAEASDDFTERAFTGPIFKQIRDAMDYINTTVIEEKVVKIQNQAESVRFFNYPYNALEEVIVNAVFHKSYHEPEPVEIRIYLDCIQVINYPGPAKWIDMERFAAGKVRARKYRNRRIGEFLKELDLSEKQSTGIPKILRVLRQNASPPPQFETDDERTYLIATIRIREGFETDIRKSAQKNERTLSELLSELLSQNDFEKLLPVIKHLEENDSIRPNEAESLLGKSSATARRYLGILVDADVLNKQGKANATVYVRVNTANSR
jgi:ATP-dependent DNA helicase RecG